MRSRFAVSSWRLVVLAFVLTISIGANGQTKTEQANPQSLSKSRSLGGVEEKLIRLAYAKLEVYNAVSAVRDGTSIREVGNGSKRLLFELSNFHEGPITEIRSKKYETMLTAPTGEIIQLLKKTIRLNDGPPRIAYGASWVPGKYALSFDRSMTIGDALTVEAENYFDLTRYVSYQVKVSLDGKSRSYNALAVLHGPTENLALEIWDAVTGFGGIVTSVLREPRLPFGLTSSVDEAGLEEEHGPRLRDYIQSPAGEGADTPRSFSCSTEASKIRQCCLNDKLARYWRTTPCDSWIEEIATPTLQLTEGDDGDQERDVQFYDSDETGHISGTGVHHGRARFRPECTALSPTTQRCYVHVVDQGYGDNPNDHSDYSYHVGVREEIVRGADGPRGQPLDCESSIGFAFNSCIIFGCNVTVGLTVSGHGVGVSATATGGNLWRTASAQGLRCNIPVGATAGGCNEPATYGCMSGYINVGGYCTRSSAFLNQCFRFGDYDDSTCACTGGCDPDGACSPIVVDVLGNGFSMTDASTGVVFDMDGRGTPHRFAWTAANSDDAWLALDRDGNGSIDSGRELFGNVTAQDIHPEGVERNGFLALAIYDSASRGGNEDGIISSADLIFDKLRLWRDDNHNGISESCELFTLREMGVEKIDLDYKKSKRTDEYGNEFRYRSKVRDAGSSDLSKWAWDVFLVKQP